MYDITTWTSLSWHVIFGHLFQSQCMTSNFVTYKAVGNTSAVTRPAGNDIVPLLTTPNLQTFQIHTWWRSIKLKQICMETQIYKTQGFVPLIGSGEETEVNPFSLIGYQNQ